METAVKNVKWFCYFHSGSAETAEKLNWQVNTEMWMPVVYGSFLQISGRLGDWKRRGLETQPTALLNVNTKAEWLASSSGRSPICYEVLWPRNRLDLLPPTIEPRISSHSPKRSDGPPGL